MIRNITVTAVLLFLAVVVFSVDAQARKFMELTEADLATVERVSVDELKEFIANDKNVFIVDVRSPGAFKHSSLRIRGDVRVIINEVNASEHLLPMNKEMLIVTYCT